MSTASAIITIIAQSRGGSSQSGETFPLVARVPNAAVSYAMYLWQTIWPLDLAAFYPRPERLSPWQVVAASAVLLGISALAVVRRRSQPHLIVGWLWFLGTLV